GQKDLQGLFDLIDSAPSRSSQARQLYHWLERAAKKRKDAASALPASCHEVFDNLGACLDEELSNLKVIRLREPKIENDSTQSSSAEDSTPASAEDSMPALPDFSLADFEDVRRIFLDDFELLPEEAQRDFAEAGRCFAFEQYKAAVMIAMRATEKMVREYFHRLTQQPENVPLEDIKSRLELMKDDLRQVGSHNILDVINQLGNFATIRNRYMHADEKVGKLDYKDAVTDFSRALELCRILIDDIRRRRLLLAVAVHKKIDFDQALALWIIQEKGGGIGRWNFYDDEKATELQLNLRDRDLQIGGAGRDFGRAPDKSISHRVAVRFNAESDYAVLIKFSEETRGGGLVV
ncbi:MAG: hypothetical protein ACREBU_25760, partial [Nitrososphaera sp.]